MWVQRFPESWAARGLTSLRTTAPQAARDRDTIVPPQPPSVFRTRNSRSAMPTALACAGYIAPLAPHASLPLRCPQWAGDHARGRELTLAAASGERDAPLLLGHPGGTSPPG